MQVTNRHRRLLVRSLAALATLPTLLAVAALPAGAHVDIDPTRAEAGAVTTVVLSFHHGKDGAATTALVVRVPQEASVVDAPAVPGWTVAREAVPGGTQVTWSGGSVPDGTEGRFPLVVRMPESPGTVLFPTVQQTAAGELAWIEAGESEDEGARPAPRIEVTASTAPPTTAPPTTGSTTTSSTAASSTTLDLPGTTNQAELRDTGDDSAAPWFIGGGVAAAALVGAGGWWLSRRR